MIKASKTKGVHNSSGCRWRYTQEFVAHFKAQLLKKKKNIHKCRIYAAGPFPVIGCGFIIAGQVRVEYKGHTYFWCQPWALKLQMGQMVGPGLSKPLTHQSRPVPASARMLDSEQPLRPREGFCTRFNWLSGTVFQRSGQRSAYVASSLCRFTPLNVCL